MGKHRWPISADTRSSTASAVRPGMGGEDDTHKDRYEDTYEDTHRMSARADLRGRALSAERGSPPGLLARRRQAARPPLRADARVPSASPSDSDSDSDADGVVGARGRADVDADVDDPVRLDRALLAEDSFPSDHRYGRGDDPDRNDDRDSRDGRNGLDDGDGYEADDEYERGDGSHRRSGRFDSRYDDVHGSRSASRPGPRGRPAQPGIRWGVARSAALVFLGVALAVGAALFLVRSSEPSAAAVSVQLGADTEARTTSIAADDPAASEPRSEPRSGSLSDAGDAPASPAEGITGGREAGTIVVYVTGAVASPGVVTMPEGTRLFEILERAGGALADADLEGINLAGLPADGEHLHILAVGEIPRSPSDVPAQGIPSNANTPRTGADGTGVENPAGTSPSGGGVVDINTATLAEVESLPRVGPVLGQRIIEWRDTNGPFERPADLDAVPGIGPAMLEGILPLITVR